MAERYWLIRIEETSQIIGATANKEDAEYICDRAPNYELVEVEEVLDD